MKATAQMGGLTREEIADLRECNIDGQPVVYLNTPARMRQLCDLALQSLESVRSEALQKLKFDLEDIETESHSPVYAARLSSWAKEAIRALSPARVAEGGPGRYELARSLLQAFGKIGQMETASKIVDFVLDGGAK